MPDAVYKQCCEQVRDQTTALGVDAIFTDPLQVRALNWEDVVQLGGLSVRFDESSIRENKEGTNSRDIFGYPVYLIHAQGKHLGLHDDIHAVMKFFEMARRYFHNQRRMTAVVETHLNNEPTVVTMMDVPKKYRDKVLRAIVVWCWFIENGRL